MRYQEIIYIQNENGAVRNRDLLNVNMSSDMCIFNAPVFNVSGATKIPTEVSACTSGDTYIISTATTIPLTFDFTANTNTFTGNNATFKYEIYKFNQDVTMFILPPIYTSGIIEYSAISATSSTTQLIPVSGLSLDGEYLVKGYFEYDACTDFLNRLGVKKDTIVFRSGSEYGLYDENLDYYFAAIKKADTPIFTNSVNDSPVINNLFQQIIFPTDGQTLLTISYTYGGFFVLTLNGLALAKDYDYTYTGNVVTLNAPCVSGDIITVIYTPIGGTQMINDTIFVTNPIVSGITGAEGSDNPYFNTSTGKFEIFTSTNPSEGDILVMINGATLANNIDYYKSISNPKKIILEGDVLVGDVILIVYFPGASVINNLYTSNPSITWSISTPPQSINGQFTLEVSTGTTFNDFYSTGLTEYVFGQTIYNDSFTASGTVGTTLYYRVKNEKNYELICGDLVTTTAYSEIVPITIISNAINSY